MIAGHPIYRTPIVRTVYVDAHAYCRLSSYLQTMANKGQNPLIAIQMALTGNVELD